MFRPSLVLAAVCVWFAPGVANAAVETEIVLCIDVSPSISQAELDLEKAGILDCLNNASIIPHDGTVAVGVVVYGHIATDVLGLTPVTPTNLTNTIQPAINGILRGLVAQTNISDGLAHARAMLDGSGSQTDDDYILLAGDGAHNTGAPEPETSCPATRNAGITICSIAIDASDAGQDDLENCANPPQGQFGIAETFADFAPVCVACIAFFLDVQCEGPTVCAEPGTCVGVIPCADIAECEAPPGTVLTRECSPDGPYERGTTGVEITCTANGQVIEQVTCNVTVMDCEAPQITCPPNRNLPCTASTSPAATGVATADDNCDAAPQISHSDSITGMTCANSYTIMRTWTATDSAGLTDSCVQTITLTDSNAPTLTCPPSIEMGCVDASGIPAASLDFGVTTGDNCDTSLEVIDDRPSGYFPPTCGGEPTVVTFTVMDDCGNTRSCEVPVRVTGTACCPAIIELDTDLTLLIADLDVRQETGGPVTTKADFDIWNSNEVRFSGTERCITCWDQTLMGDYPLPNHFLLQNLQTDHGKARIDGVPSPVVCDDRGTTSVATPLLGLAIKQMRFTATNQVNMRSGVPLVGIGRESATILYDLGPEGPEDSVAGGLAISSAGGSAAPFDANTVGFGTAANNLASISKKGSLIYWPKIELKWDTNGQLIQDTFVTLLNDNIGAVRVKLYQVNGDAPLPPVINGGVVVERAHPGWNNSDIELVLTADESNYWSAATGQPKGVSPFWVLDPGNPAGRPDTDPSNPGGRVLRGFLVGWAIDEETREIRWNHLRGAATVVNFRDGTAWDYESWSFQCVSGVDTGQPCDSQWGQLLMNGEEYDFCPERLLLDFFATGSMVFSHPDAEN